MSVYMCGSNLYSQIQPCGPSVVCCPTLIQDMEGHCVQDMVFTVPGVVHRVVGQWFTRGKNPMLNQSFKQLSKLSVSDSGDRGIGISEDGKEVLELSRNGKKIFILSYGDEKLKHGDDGSKFLRNNSGEKSKSFSTEFIWCDLFSNSQAVVIDKVGRLWQEGPLCPTPTLHLSNPLLRLKEVSCGASHAVALSTEGEVLTWGNGMRGELGIPQCSHSSSPTAVPLLGGVKIAKVCAGSWHCLALGVCGEVYVWGWNADGQLGLPFKPTATKGDVGCSLYHCCTENCRDEAAVTGSPTSADSSTTVNVQTVPVMLDCFGDSDVVAIAAGDRHSVFLLDNGDVFTCGWNRYGQLGIGCNSSTQRGMSRLTNLPGAVRDIHAGSWYSCFLI